MWTPIAFDKKLGSGSALGAIRKTARCHTKPTLVTCLDCRDYFFSVKNISQPVAGQSLVLNSGVVDHGQGATQLIVEEPQGVVLNREHVKGTVPQDLVKNLSRY